MRSWGARIVAASALAAAGALTFAAAWERWWPACPRGGFDSAACLRVQSHELDYLVPSAPWQPTGQSATYAGFALLALALAALTLPLVLRPTRPVGRWRITRLLLGVVPAGALGVLGATTLRSGQTGEPATGSALLATAFVVWAVAWPGALMVFAALAPGRPHGIVLAALVGLSTPVPVVLAAGPIAAGYVSHDTAPWTEATAAPLLLVAAIVACRAPHARRAPATGVRRVAVGHRHVLGSR
ncbi:MULTISPECIES: hypothetical protein [unclassified Nocardioides]|uniref:hypothetical protein n=1 Tax=unclassified Nocardioides TaxID=2615069 RepID=UPI003606868B